MPSQLATESAHLALASTSPRRQALVGLLGCVVRLAPVEVDEAAFLLSDPFVGALNVAVAKARAALPAPAEIVVAADTLVVADGASLGKPDNASHAVHMLRRLRGRPHEVLTGVALRTADERRWGGVVSTRVVMRDYTDAEIEDYVHQRGQAFDKAGGYAVQDTLFRPVERLDGCYLNVVGLPLCAVAAGLASLGVALGDAGPPPTPSACGFCTAGQALVSIRA